MNFTARPLPPCIFCHLRALTDARAIGIWSEDRKDFPAERDGDGWICQERVDAETGEIGDARAGVRSE